jgi:two-component system, OmpR family, KDP operon response regulator KdpE
MKPHVLIVDDDMGITKLVAANLKARGFEVTPALNGEEAIAAVEKEPFSLIILDIMMPKLDGFEVCRQIREWSKVPIIMLSARGDEKDKVKCLELGADDYLTKPFGVDELIARVKTALRHAEAAHSEPSLAIIVHGPLEMNFLERRVRVHGSEVRLTPTEYQVLQELVTNANKVITHRMLLQKVWGTEYSEEREYLRVFINRLRKKLTNGHGGFKSIATVPGVGYRFDVN